MLPKVFVLLLVFSGKFSGLKAVKSIKKIVIKTVTTPVTAFTLIKRFDFAFG
jgi:hypothetical protein